MIPLGDDGGGYGDGKGYGGGHGKGYGKGYGRGKGYGDGKGGNDAGKGYGKGYGEKGYGESEWIERRACHGCNEVGHILRDCPKAGGAGKDRAASLALEDGAATAPGGPVSRGTFASFAVKRRPVGCASDSVWRSVGSCGMAMADH